MLEKKHLSLLLSLTLSLCLFVGIMASVDYILGFYTKPQFDSEIDQSLYDGFELVADKTITQTFRAANWRHTAQYTLTKDRLRFTPVSNPEDRDRFFAMFGCSFVFGTTVNDDETIPAYIGRNQTRYMPYNFGKPGMGVQSAYRHLLTHDLREELREDNGILAYLYLSFHFRRTIGGVPSPGNTADAPCIILEDGALTMKGSFREASPWRWFVYETLRKLNTPWFFNYTFPLNAPQPEHWDLIAALFVESARLFYDAYPDGRFVVVFWSDPLDMTEISRRTAASDVSIETVDLGRMIQEQGATIKTFPDGHNTPQSNNTLSSLLIDALSMHTDSPLEPAPLDAADHTKDALVGSE